MMHPRYYARFTRYILKHKWFVFVAGLKTGAPLWRLLVHDYTKFFPIEFLSYTEFFNGDKSDPRVQAAFERGKRHHLTKNPHHPEFWLTDAEDGIREIPEHFVREMVADWMAASRAITGHWSAPQWYAENRDRILLHPKTRERAERLLAEASERIAPGSSRPLKSMSAQAEI